MAVAAETMSGRLHIVESSVSNVVSFPQHKPDYVGNLVYLDHYRSLLEEQVHDIAEKKIAFLDKGFTFLFQAGTGRELDIAQPVFAASFTLPRETFLYTGRNTPSGALRTLKWVKNTDRLAALLPQAIPLHAAVWPYTVELYTSASAESMSHIRYQEAYTASLEPVAAGYKTDLKNNTAAATMIELMASCTFMAPVK